MEDGATNVILRERRNLKRLYQKHYDLKSQCRFKWCTGETGIRLPFDVGMEDGKILFELDGGQHFNQVMNWKSPELNQESDKFKMRCANKNGYSVIRVIWEDVYYNRNEWLKKLTSSVDKILNEGGVWNIFICSNDEYEVYMD